MSNTEVTATDDTAGAASVDPATAAPAAEAPAAPATEAPTPEPEARQGSEPEAQPASDPVDYSGVTAPEGMTDAQLTRVREFAREQGLSTEAANAVAAREMQVMNGQLDQAADELRQAQEEWKSNLAADNEFGGDHLAVTQQRVDSFLERFDDGGALRAVLEGSGLQGHEHLVRVLARAEAALEPGRVAAGDAPAGSSPSVADTWYGKTTPASGAG